MNHFFEEAMPYLMIVAVAALVVFGVLFLKPVAASGGDLENCEPWRKAGDTLIYRCEDEYSDDRCYLSTTGMMFCLTE